MATSVDCSQQSLTYTTVLAWYNSVTRGLEPITSGYRLTLSFNLIHTTTSPLPALPANASIIPELRHISLSWRQKEDANPLQIIYLLDNTYDEEGLKGSVLTGVDARSLAFLKVAAAGCGVHIGLATFECQVSGRARNTAKLSRWLSRHPDYGSDDYDDYRVKYGKYGHSDDEDEDEDDDGDEDDVSMASEPESQLMEINNLVDLDGNVLTSKILTDEAKECIPGDLQSEVESGEIDSEEFEGYESGVRRLSILQSNLIQPSLHSVVVN